MIKLRPASPDPTVAIAIANLFTFYRKKLDPHVVLVYARAVQAYSPPLVEAAVAHAMDTRIFLPKPPELRADAETCRQALLKAHPHQPCETCADLPGWTEITDDAGVKRITRCACWLAWRDRLTGLGILPAAPTPAAAATAPSVPSTGWSDARDFVDATRPWLKVVR